MKRIRQYALYISLGILLLLGMTACNFFKKNVPPNEMFKNAEKHRKNDNLLEAAKIYDDLIQQHENSELVPPALYYSGFCKYTLSLRSPGKKEFEQREGGLSDAKKTIYSQWIEYMNDHQDHFLYVEPIDKYLYQGTEFKTLIENYPASNLVDDAAFQLIHTHILAKSKTSTLTIATALQMYADYCSKYPQSPYRKKGVEHLIQLVSKYSETMLNNNDIVIAYQELARSAENIPDVAQLSYLLGIKFIEVHDLKNAASILNVPSVLGIGIVETQQTRLNIRSGQGTQYRIVAKADKGDQLLLLSKSGQWYNIQLQDGTVGYAHSDFIKEFQE